MRPAVLLLLFIVMFQMVACGGGGGGGGSKDESFDGLDDGTAANQIDRIKLTGTVNEAATVQGQGYELASAGGAALVAVDDADLTTDTDYEIVLDLDGIDLPEDPRQAEGVDMELIVETPASELLTIELIIGAER